MQTFDTKKALFCFLNGINKEIFKMIKDSGARVKMAGMERDTDEGKTRYDLVFDGPMFERWAQHLTAGAKKYAARNWMGAKSQEELNRFIESAIRHFIQWISYQTDEDHAAAVFFNINGAEMVKEKLKGTPVERRSLRDRRVLYATGYRRVDSKERRHG